jgi:Fic family protein
MIKYQRPTNWIQYDRMAILDVLIEAKAAVLSLQTVPYQKRWVDRLQKLELKREVAGTSRIEGAEFTTHELDRAMTEETSSELFTRSQRQAHAATLAYAWIRKLLPKTPVKSDLIREIHRMIVTGADDDHCPPGKLRESMQNVTFGSPPHRGCDGGAETEGAFEAFTDALASDYGAHDPLVQAIAAHYHIAAMHPFLDGNGRTARATEAFMLRKAGLRDTTFIAMSNYYYDEKTAYLSALAETRKLQHDLTPFLRFALRGVVLQAKRLLGEIQREIKRDLVRQLMHELNERLRSPRRRVIMDRQGRIMSMLLEVDDMSVEDFFKALGSIYDGLKADTAAFRRDVGGLIELGALAYDPTTDRVRANLDWPQHMTATEFFQKVKEMPTVNTSWLRR